MGVDKSDVLKKMREAEAIYVLMSDCTRMPFVVCDPETYDDQVLIFFSEEEAMKGGQEFLKEGNPLKIFNIENKYMLSFYSSLFPAGVNGMWVGKDTEEEIKLQLTELVRRPEQKPGEEPIENPSFQITAMYFMQKARKQKEMKITEDMKDLQEELMAHYQDATFITAVTEEKKMPVLNKNDGQVLLPVFTDVQGNLITLLPLLSITRTKTAADRWEGLTVLIFAAIGIYMIIKGIKKKNVLERRKDEIEWKKTTLLAMVTSVDAFFVGMGLGFLDTAMIEESLVLLPVTVLEAVIGIFAGYRLGLKENRRAYWIGGALLLLASFDVILHYYM